MKQRFNVDPRQLAPELCEALQTALQTQTVQCQELERELAVERQWDALVSFFG
jgi:hypothetical protein